MFNFCCDLCKPYDDEYMIFDRQTGHYVLTSKYVLDTYGIDLLDGVNDRNSVNAQIAVNAVLKRVSRMIYNFIHSYSIYNENQDFLLAHNSCLRSVIQEAMGEQFVYMQTVGDFSHSSEAEKRALAIDQNAKEILLNSGICYSGV